MKGVWFDLTMRMLGTDEAMTKVVAEADKGGAEAGKTWSKAFGKSASDDTAKSLKAMEGQVKSATAVLERESAKSVKLWDSVQDAADQVMKKEATLAAQRERQAASSARFTAAEEDFTKAKTDGGISADVLKQKEFELNDLRRRNAADSARFVGAERDLAKAKRDSVAASREATTQAKAEFDAQSALISKQTDLTAARLAEQSKGAGFLGLSAAGAGGAAAIGVGGAAILGFESMKKSGDFQQSMQKDVDTGGLSQRSMPEVSKGILQISTETGYSAKELADATYTVSSGMTAQAHATNEAKNTLDLLRAASQLATEENSDLHGTTDALTTTVKDYGSAAGTSAQIASEMNAALSHGKMTLDELGPALGQVQASAAAANVPYKDLLATLAQANSHGLPVEQAAQNANHAITALQAPTEKMTAMLAAVGIDSTQLSADLGTKGLSGTMEEIHQAIEQHIGPGGKMMVDVFSHSKVATEDAAAAYDKLPPKLKAIADQVKAGTLKASLASLEGQGLDLTSANQVEQFAERWKKATGFSSLLTGGKNLDLTSQQAMNMAMGTMDASRLAGFVTGKDNQADIQATLRDETSNANEAKRTGQVVGFAKSQETYNAKLKDTKAAFGRLEIEIGNRLLPVGERMLGWVQKGTDFLERHHVIIGKVADALMHYTGFVLKNFVENLVKVVHVGEDVWHALDSDVIHPLKTAARDVGEAFKSGSKVASDAWGDMRKALGEPTYAVVQYIWNDGIRSMWNGASDLLGGMLGHIPPVDVSHLAHFADGGIYEGPGIVPGRDTGVDNTNARLRRGEGVAVPKFVQWFGEDNWHAANRYFSGRGGSGNGFNYDVGGIFGDVAHPLEALEHKLLGKAEDALSMAGKGPWGEMLRAAPRKLVHSMLHWASSHLSPGSLLHSAGHLLGFADGGISDGDLGGTLSSDTAAAPSGLQVALQGLRDHLSTMYDWGGANLDTGVDCSGLAGDELLLATGQKPDHRVGTTDTLMAGGWPGMIKGANSSDLFILGVNKTHMAGSILGQPFEARTPGEKIRTGPDAVDPFDAQFVQQWHLDPTLINPPYNPGESGDPNSDLPGYTSDKAQRYRQEAQHELELARKHDAAAQKYLDDAAKYRDGLPAANKKHLDAQQRYLREAAKADSLAARTTGAAHQRHLDAAEHYHELADKAAAAASKGGGKAQTYLDRAKKAQQEAADERHRAQVDEYKAEHVRTGTGKHHKGDGTDGGLMTFTDFTAGVGREAGQAFLDSTGLGDTILADPNKSAVLRVGNALTHLKLSGKAPNWSASPFLPGTKQNQDLSDLLPATHDLGGPIWPGLNLVNNKTGGTEEVINPQLPSRGRDDDAPRGARGAQFNAPIVQIGTWQAAGSDQAEANRLGRTVLQYARSR